MIEIWEAKKSSEFHSRNLDLGYAYWSWTGQFFILSLNFLTCKVEIIILSLMAYHG